MSYGQNSSSTIFQLYQDEGMLIMKGSVQLSDVQKGANMEESKQKVTKVVSPVIK